MSDDQHTEEPEQAPEVPEPKPETPPWGDNFDPARAWKTIQSLRAREKELAPLAQKAKEQEDAQKSEAERLREERDALKAERDTVRSEAMRLRIAAEKGLTPKQAARLRGDTEEELSADADELLAEFTSPRRFGDVDQGVKSNGPKAQDDPKSLADAVIAQRGH